MKIFLASQSKQKIGGGWTFLNNFEKYAKRKGVEIKDGSEIPNKDTIVLISGATMVERELMQAIKSAGCKIVLRVDGIPRNSRNRNTGTSRLFEFAQMADLVIYQSQWAKDYIKPFLKKDGPVIINGADTEIFNPDGPRQPQEGKPQYIYTRYRRDEDKRWQQAWYEYTMIHRNWPNAHIWIIGNFSPEQQQYNFDFFMGEKYRYVGVLEDPKDMAEYLRGAECLLMPSFNDPCSQALIEARQCGVPNIRYDHSGGTDEIMSTPLEELTADRMVDRYLEEFSKL